MRRFQKKLIVCVSAACLGVFVPLAQAKVALLLEQPYGRLGVVDPAGHSAIYLDHVCAETPLKLRACHAGELGVVISRYDGIGTYDWVAMPLIPYLYAVDSARDIPVSVDRGQEVLLRDAYRRKYLESVAPDTAEGTAPGGNWYELLGSALDRTIYGFEVKTTPDQDAALIAEFNDRRNKEEYNGLFNNCADFSRVVLNRFYPHAVHRNWIADLGLTSPKSVARGLSHYAHKHPEAELQVFEVPQVKGSLPRSHAAVDLAEGILKRYAVPLAVFSPEATAVVFAAYVGHGRFSMPKDPPLLNVSTLDPNVAAAPVVTRVSETIPAKPGDGQGRTAGSVVSPVTFLGNELNP
jgi:hypothetical protein